MLSYSIPSSEMWEGDWHQHALLQKCSMADNGTILCRSIKNVLVKFHHLKPVSWGGTSPFEQKRNCAAEILFVCRKMEQRYYSMCYCHSRFARYPLKLKYPCHSGRRNIAVFDIFSTNKASSVKRFCLFWSVISWSIVDCFLEEQQGRTFG